MRLKTLRKERPQFESEGAIINGSRMDLSNSDFKAIRHRSNTLFALPASLNSEHSILNVSPLGYSDEINNYHIDQTLVPIMSESSNPSPYQTIEAAYLEHGIRIRLSPTRMTPTGQTSERKATPNFQRRTAFISRNPHRTSSVLQYATHKQNQYSDTRSFSALQQISTSDFESTNDHEKSYTHSSQITEEIPEDYIVSLIKANEYSNIIDSPNMLSTTDGIESSTALCNNDPDLAYMTKLLNQPNGECMRETIRRRAGLRGTFAVHRNPIVANSNQSQVQQQSNLLDKSPNTNRNSVMRNKTIAVAPPSSPERIDQEILKHVSRLRRRSLSRDVLPSSPRTNSASFFSSPSRINTSSITSSSPSRFYSNSSLTKLNTISSPSKLNTNSSPLRLNPSSIPDNSPPRINSSSITSSLPSRHNPNSITSSSPPRLNSSSITSSSPPRLNSSSITSSSPPRFNRSSTMNSSPLRINTMSINSPPPSRTNVISNGSSLSRANTIAVAGSELRMSTTNNYTYTRNSNKKPLKAMSLEPLEILLSSTSHPTSLAKSDIPTIGKTSTLIDRDLKTPIKRTKSALSSTVKILNTNNIPLKENSILSSIFRDESLSSMKTSTIDAVRHLNSCDSGYFDRSSSGGDIQSLTSSSLAQIQTSLPSGRLNSSMARRSNTNKKVSFSEEPTAVILTTATYV